MHRLAVFTFALATVIGVGAGLLTVAPAAAQQGAITGEVPAPGRFGLVVWGGGTAEAARTALRAQGCDPVSLFVTRQGTFIGFIYDAPPFPNAPFLELFPGTQLPAGTAVIVTCKQSAASEGLVPAPIHDVDIGSVVAAPPPGGGGQGERRWVARVVSGLPNGCHQFARFEVERRGELIVNVTVLNRVPTGPVVCTQQYGYVTTEIQLGSDFVSGRRYTVQVNDVSREFIVP